MSISAELPYIPSLDTPPQLDSSIVDACHIASSLDGTITATYGALPQTEAIDTKSEDATTASRSPADSIDGLSSLSQQPEGELPSNDELFKHESNISVDLKKSSIWNEEKENIIKRPFDYIMSLGGKGFRRQILLALNVWLQVDEESCEIIDRTVSMLHNSSLLIDDIQDGSKQRRGSLSAHEVFGIAQTINAANYIYFEAQNQLRKLENWQQAFVVFNEELLNLHRGQGMDLYWRDTLQPPSEADYLQMIANKTGGLFRLILRLLQCSSKCEYDLEPLVDVIGLMFQILDDYKNLKEDKMTEQKGYSEDLTEGKFSYPVSHAIWINDPRKGEILGILKTKPTDDIVKAHVVKCLEQAGSFDYTRAVLEGLYERVRLLLNEIPQRNAAIDALVEKLISSTRNGN